MKRLMLCLLCVVTSSAEAAEPGLDELEGLLDTPVVEAASRTQERADDAPATVTLISADELRRFGLRSLHEAINFLSVGLVAQDPLHSVEVGARGVSLSADYGNHLLVVIDGHSINESWNGTAYFEQGLGIPLEAIDHLELIVGPGSVLYGSSAMLGVVNVVTKRAKDLGRVQLTVEGSLLPPQGADGAPQLRAGFGGTGRVSLMTGWEGQLAGHPLEATLALEYFAHRGQSLTYRVQSGLTETDGTRTWAQRWGSRAPGAGAWGGITTDSWWTQVPSGLLKVRWGDFSLWLRGALSARGAPAVDGFGVAADFDAPNTELDRWVNIELRWQRRLAERVTLLARLYFDRYDYLASYQTSSWLLHGGATVPDVVDPADFTFRQEIRAGSRWGGVELQSTIDWLDDGRFPLLLGVDARLRGFHDGTFSDTLDGQRLTVENEYQTLEWQVAGYVQQRARVLPSLQLNIGARLDTQSGFAPRVSPRAAAVWTTPWDGRLKAVFSTAFRTPSGYERFAQYDGFQQRNPELVPETVMTGELGYEQRLGRHRFSLIGFASRFEGLIHLQELGGGLFHYENHGQLLNVGAQGMVEGAAGPLSWAASLTGAVNSSNDEPLTSSPGWFGNARVMWSFGDEKPRASLLANFSGARLISAAHETSLDANGNVVTWAPGTERVGPQVELRAAVEGNVKQVPGLWLRGVVGAQLMPFSSYVVGPVQTPTVDANTPALSPNSRLFVLITVGWALGR
jgi:outer membrane receptor for ferrienterochelin and colicin